MQTYTVHEAQTHLPRLIEQAARGEPFTIARESDGEPLVKVVAVKAQPPQSGRFGFLAGQIQVPDDFDEMGADDIARLFGTGA